MNFGRSFNELKKQMVWVHYLLGTVGILFVFNYLMDKNFVTAESSVLLIIAVFYATLTIVDRIIHYVLFKASFMELKNPKLLLHYGIDAVGITFVIKYLMDMKYISTDANFIMFSAVFFGVYVLVDRLSHGVLELA